MSVINPDFLSVSQLAEQKNVTTRTVYSWIREGIAPAYEREAGRYWFHKQSATDFVPPKRGRKPDDQRN